MALGPRLSARTTQRLFMSAQMRSALSVLRLSNIELAELITRELTRNPFLRRLPGRAPPSHELRPTQIEAPAESLHESLLRQVAGQGLALDVLTLARWLVGELREDGYLDADTMEKAARADPQILAAALAAVQRCEPVGVGARSVAECIALQLGELGLSASQAQATTSALSFLAQGDIAGAARHLGVTQAEARRRAGLIARVNTRPVAPPVEDRVLYRADLILVRDAARGDRLELAQGLGRSSGGLGLDRTLIEAARRDGFGLDLLAQAQAFLAALDARGETLLRLGAALLARQPEAFLPQGRVVHPLTQADLAQDLGLHPSTVSRALRDKVIDIDGRLWPIASFFSRALRKRPSQDKTGDRTPGEETISSARIQSIIAASIAREDPARPLSDTAITRLLQAEGVDIARRTVAKYRQGLRIPSAASRRRRNARRQDGRGA